MAPGPTIAEPDVEQRSELAPQWKVLLLDDEITTFEFVTWLLMDVFQKPKT